MSQQHGAAVVAALRAPSPSGGPSYDVHPEREPCRPTVLKVAVLAEKYAVDYSWYVDTILNLIRIAGDYVSEEVWYRVIQIVINRDDVQGYAAKTVFEADPIGTPIVLYGAGDVSGHVSTDTCRHPATVLEEMPPFPERESSILAKLKKKKGPGAVSELEEGKKDPNAEINGGVEPTPSTARSSWPTTPHFGGEEDVSGSATCYLFARELLLRLLRRIVATGVHSIIPEMGPFGLGMPTVCAWSPAFLVDCLSGRIYGPRAVLPSCLRVTGFNGLAVLSQVAPIPTPIYGGGLAGMRFEYHRGPGVSLGGRLQHPLVSRSLSTPSPSADLLGLRSAPVTGSAAPSAGNLLVDVFSDSPSATASVAPGTDENFLSSGSTVSEDPALPIAEADELLNKFVCKNNGVLFENQLLQIGVKSEFRQNLGRMYLFYGNKTSVQFQSFTPTVSYPGELQNHILLHFI
ncbi:hypothetical protein AB205_0159170 [Aquarana catesbeiana]|uniref:Uncharacterized protein n=1 Tax=Aquarana catesbeiana TaxID=8400 RepID=A0A2G9S9K1_AQUCT|nr:hypothetical protein AB205_0159170 [Aquarana catesbeiana]